MSKQVLVCAAHPDDETLGLGGTVARHVSTGDNVTIAILVDAGRNLHKEDSVETIQEVRSFVRTATSKLGVSEVRFAGLAHQKLDTLPILEIILWIEGVLEDIQPQIIYTHHLGDLNYDHRIVHQATLTAARPYSAPCVERILCYETPSSTEWASPNVGNYFSPNVFTDISAYLENKLDAMSIYTNELRSFPHPRSLESLRARAIYWGSIIGVSAAEPFMLAREIRS